MTAVPPPRRKTIWRLLAPFLFPATLLFSEDVPAPELYLRMCAAAMLGVALWTLADWPDTGRRHLSHKVCFVLYQGFWFGVWMALFVAEPGDRASALIIFATGVVIYGPILLFFSKEQADGTPAQDTQVPRILVQLLLGVFATAAMLASGAPVSASGILAAGVLFALPVPSDRQLAPGETRLRTALFLLLLISAIAVMVLY